MNLKIDDIIIHKPSGDIFKIHINGFWKKLIRLKDDAIYYENNMMLKNKSVWNKIESKLYYKLKSREKFIKTFVRK